MTQHAGKLLGYKPEALPYLNLNNQTYVYDTYHIYLTSLRKYIEHIYPNLFDNNLDKIILRTVFKNMIMTIEYGVTEYTAFHEYCSTIDEHFISTPALLNKLKSHQIFKIFFDFFKQGLANNDLFFSNKNI